MTQISTICHPGIRPYVPPIQKSILPFYLILYRLILAGFFCYAVILSVQAESQLHDTIHFGLCSLFIAEPLCLCTMLVFYSVPQKKSSYDKQRYSYFAYFFTSLIINIAVFCSLWIKLMPTTIRSFITVFTVTTLVDLLMIKTKCGSYERQFRRRKEAEEASSGKKQKSQSRRCNAAPSLKVELCVRMFISLVTIGMIMFPNSPDGSFHIYEKLTFAVIILFDDVHISKLLIEANPQNELEVYAFEEKMRRRCLTRYMFLHFPIVYLDLVADFNVLYVLQPLCLYPVGDRAIIDRRMKKFKKRLGNPLKKPNA